MSCQTGGGGGGKVDGVKVEGVERKEGGEGKRSVSEITQPSCALIAPTPAHQPE